MQPKTPHRSRRFSGGFTLTEMLFAVAITCMVIAGFCAVFVTQTKEYRMLRDKTEMQQNSQAAMMLLVRDVRQAGYGLPVTPGQVSQWVTWVANITNSICVRQGTAGAPDRLLLTGAFGAPVGTLQTAAARGATLLQLGTGEGVNFNTTSRKLIFIGKEELARITAVSGDQLTITSHPTLSGRGMRYPYPASTSIELVQVLEYGCENSFTNILRRPFLYRDDHRGIITNRIQQMTTLGIDDFQITQTSNTLTLAFSAVAVRPEPDYTHPTRGDHYRRLAVSGSVMSRNWRK